MRTVLGYVRVSSDGPTATVPAGGGPGQRLGLSELPLTVLSCIRKGFRTLHFDRERLQKASAGAAFGPFGLRSEKLKRWPLGRAPQSRPVAELKEAECGRKRQRNVG